MTTTLQPLRTYKCKTCGEWCWGERCRACWVKSSRINWSDLKQVSDYNKKKYLKSHPKDPTSKLTEALKKRVSPNWTKIEIRPKMVMSRKPFFYCQKCNAVMEHYKVDWKYWKCYKCLTPNRPRRSLMKAKNED